jgi:hypothetical protein
VTRAPVQRGACGRNLVGDGARIFAAGRSHDAGALLRELTRDRLSNSARCAGDDGDPPDKSIIVEAQLSHSLAAASAP